jgi:hypothetical protein
MGLLISECCAPAGSWLVRPGSWCPTGASASRCCLRRCYRDADKSSQASKKKCNVSLTHAADGCACGFRQNEERTHEVGACESYMSRMHLRKMANGSNRNTLHAPNTKLKKEAWTTPCMHSKFMQSFLINIGWLPDMYLIHARVQANSSTTTRSPCAAPKPCMQGCKHITMSATMS